MGCSSREGGERTFEIARTFEPVGRDIRWEASSAERFGISPGSFSPAGAPPAAPGIAYALPAGWSELPTSQFREANFRVGDDPRAECYLSTLSGEGGGLAANVNRWRTQMSLLPLASAEIDALPRVDWLGKRAVRVDFTGTWVGMSGDADAADWRLVGLLLVEPTQSRFLKMTGPASVIEREVASFDALAASFRVGPAPRDDGGFDPGATLPEGHPPIDGSSAGDSTAADAGATVVPGNRSASGYEWTPPAGWRRGPEKAMREITYLVGEGDEVECYVTLLAGNGGGMLANVNRWCGQMGRAPLSAEELERLARVEMLGVQATIVELERGGAATTSAEYLLGAVCLLPERSVFVKLTGPRAVLERERTAFQEFCKSARAAE